MPLGITMGDSSGVGPEIILSRFAAGELDEDIVIYGDLSVLRAGVKHLNLEIDLYPISSPSDLIQGRLNILDLGLLTESDWAPGILNAKSGAAAYQYVLKATEDSLNRDIDAIVTMPINKEATRLSYASFTGHTELIAEICGTKECAMMLATEQVAVSHVSTHISLAEAIKTLNSERVEKVIELTHNTVVRYKNIPRIAVCGLNPHAGENGIFGNEETKIIAPAIDATRNKGISVSGPYPADTVFYQAIHQDAFDAIVCMYHDQGHAPMKLWAFRSAVNTTIGLPIIRTSVDHGTAFDIAWSGKAFTESLQHALNFARKLARAC